MEHVDDLKIVGIIYKISKRCSGSWCRQRYDE